MIDASIIAAPRQRNTDAEKADLKAGRVPEDWAANPAKLRQKDRDGRWTLKRGRRKPKPDGTPMMGSPHQSTVTRAMSASTAVTGSSGPGR